MATILHALGTLRPQRVAMHEPGASLCEHSDLEDQVLVLLAVHLTDGEHVSLLDVPPSLKEQPKQVLHLLPVHPTGGFPPVEASESYSHL